MSEALTGVRHGRWALAGEPLYRDVGDEVFILTRDSQMHWLKNDSARFLWERLIEAGPDGRTTLELAESLTETFEVERDAALRDVSLFVDHLRRHGVVTQVTSDDETPARAPSLEGERRSGAADSADRHPDDSISLMNSAGGATRPPGQGGLTGDATQSSRGSRRD